MIRTAPSAHVTATSNADRAWVTAFAAISEATRQASATSRSSACSPRLVDQSVIAPATIRRAAPTASGAGTKTSVVTWPVASVSVGPDAYPSGAITSLWRAQRHPTWSRSPVSSTVDG